MTNVKQNHPYHLVDPSPWPIIGAAAALILAMGLLMFMHELNGNLSTSPAGSIVLAIGVIYALSLTDIIKCLKESILIQI